MLGMTVVLVVTLPNNKMARTAAAAVGCITNIISIWDLWEAVGFGDL
jgi:hypothetical protein